MSGILIKDDAATRGVRPRRPAARHRVAVVIIVMLTMLPSLFKFLENRPLPPHAACSADAELLDIVAAQPLAAGREVYNTYGEHGNAELVNKYGFALPNNSFDEVRRPPAVCRCQRQPVAVARCTIGHLNAQCLTKQPSQYTGRQLSCA